MYIYIFTYRCVCACVGAFVFVCVCVRVCLHVSGASKVEGTITDAKNISPNGMAYECEAQTACKARKDDKGYFQHRGYFDGYPTYHLLAPGTETWVKGSHTGLVASVKVKRESATAVVATKTSREAGHRAKKPPVMKVLKKPAKR